MPFVLVLVLLLLAAAPAFAQLRLVRVDPSNEQVTVRNFGATEEDVRTRQLCHGLGTYTQLQFLPLVQGSLDLAAGAEVVVQYTGELPDSGAGLGLYTGAPFTDPANMLDWMQYEITNGVRENVAVAKLIWVENETVTGGGPYVYTGDGTQVGASFWATEQTAPIPLLPGAGLVLLATATLLVALRRV
jgi:hypothetical protein